MTTFWDKHITNPGWGDPLDHPQRLWLAKTLPKDASVLEIGYGTGKDYRNIKDIVSAYRGYDFTANFLHMCKTAYPEGDFRLGSVLSIPELDCSWDIVFARHVLEHVKQWKDAIAEMVRVSRQGVILVSWREWTDGPTRDRPGQVTSLSFNADEFKAELKKHGPYRVFRLQKGGPVVILARQGCR